MNAEVDSGTFTNFNNLFFYLFVYFVYNFFDACRMDTSICNELVEG